MHTPSKTIKITIKENTYDVPFPNTGQYLDIRNRIGLYLSDVQIKTTYDQYAMLLAEAIATYGILIPNLLKDINVDSILKLDMFESKEILDTYTEIYKPFFDEWMKLITKPKVEAQTNG